MVSPLFLANNNSKPSGVEPTPSKGTKKEMGVGARSLKIGIIACVVGEEANHPQAFPSAIANVA
jgi:hypothetical protein